ncbi:MAG: HAD-IIIA family hydrolase [Verrucomicrobiales bacterium]|nr:HAD-IIIA family hydrolase [Verrucomicrobiales bacterium]
MKSIVPDSNPKPLRPAVFFDRDGVVNRSPGPGYVLDWDVFEFNPGFFEAFGAVKNAGWLVVLITSQKGVGKGLMTQADLDEIHGNLQDSLRAKFGRGFDGIYAFTGTPDCPHQSKPDPEMIHAAAEELGIDLARSWMIGDADRDILMGKAAGLAGTIRLLGEKPVGEGAEAVFTIENSTEMAAQLMEIMSISGD